VAEGVVVSTPTLLRRTRSTAVVEVVMAELGELDEPAADSSRDPIGLATITFAVLPTRTHVQRMGTGDSADRTDFALPGSGLTAPLHEVLGVRDLEPGVVELPMTGYVGNSLGALQGGVAAMMLELSALSMARPQLGTKAAVLDLAINYLSLARVGPVRTRARVLRDGGNEQLVRTELLDAGDEDRLCTVATVLLREDSP
jgi:uncharacterized protein (TIGR00369 family)